MSETRPAIDDMTIEERTKEILALLRAFEDAFNAFASSPMARMIPGGVPTVNGKR